MAYLHCHSCDWSQDDFWSKEGYHPFRSIPMDYLRASLFKDKIYLDQHCIEGLGIRNNHGHDEEGHWVSGKEYVLAQLKRKIRNIENMAVKTEAEWKLVKDDFKCPKCGSQNCDID